MFVDGSAIIPNDEDQIMNYNEKVTKAFTLQISKDSFDGHPMLHVRVRHVFIGNNLKTSKKCNIQGS
jgi:hypothetical protein